MSFWSHIGSFSSIFGNSNNQTEEDSIYRKYKREIDRFSLEPPPIVKHHHQLVKSTQEVGELDKIESIEDVMKHFGSAEKDVQKSLIKKK